MDKLRAHQYAICMVIILTGLTLLYFITPSFTTTSGMAITEIPEADGVNGDDTQDMELSTTTETDAQDTKLPDAQQDTRQDAWQDMQDIDDNTNSTTRPDEERARRALDVAEQDVARLQVMNLPTRYASDVLAEAWQDFAGENITKLLARVQYLNETGQTWQAFGLYNKILEAEKEGNTKIGENYLGVLEKTARIAATQQQEIRLFDELSVLWQHIQEANASGLLKTDSGIPQQYQQAEQEFYDERYDYTEAAIQKTYQQLEEETMAISRAKALVRNSQYAAIAFVKDHILITLIGFISLTIVLYFLHNEVQILLLTSKINRMQLEKDALDHLKRRCQIQHYEKGVTSKSVYELGMEEYRAQELAIKQQLPGFIGERQNHLKKRPQWSMGWLNIQFGHLVGWLRQKKATLHKFKKKEDTKTCARQDKYPWKR